VEAAEPARLLAADVLEGADVGAVRGGQLVGLFADPHPDHAARVPVAGSRLGSGERRRAVRRGALVLAAMTPAARLAGFGVRSIPTGTLVPLASFEGSRGEGLAGPKRGLRRDLHRVFHEVGPDRGADAAAEGV